MKHPVSVKLESKCWNETLQLLWLHFLCNTLNKEITGSYINTRRGDGFGFSLYIDSSGTQIRIVVFIIRGKQLDVFRFCDILPTAGICVFLLEMYLKEQPLLHLVQSASYAYYPDIIQRAQCMHVNFWAIFSRRIKFSCALSS